MRPKNPVPSYLRHQATGQARVVIGGKTYYLGPYNSPESRAEYGRLIGEWSANNQTVTPTPTKTASKPDDITVSQLRLAYFRHAEVYYVKNGLQTSEVDVIRVALRVLKADYDHTLAKNFGPVALEACRQKLVARGRAKLGQQAGRGHSHDVQVGCLAGADSRLRPARPGDPFGIAQGAVGGKRARTDWTGGRRRG